MITTPEQMREAAIDACKKVADEAKSYGIPQMAMGANTCCDAIRAIPIAPQPVATKRLLRDQFSSAMAYPDGWRSNMGVVEQGIWANGFQTCREQVGEHISAMTIHPGDPLSDPRVKALVDAANDAKIILAEYEPHPLPILGRLLTALRAIGGEA